MAEQPHILVIEDDAATRDAMSLVLELQGYAVTGAANGQDALVQLRTGTRPNLILLDLMMPILDGWGFRAQQQQDPGLASIPVVVVSADGSVRQKAASLGAAGYLMKPVEVEDLLDTVQRHC